MRYDQCLLYFYLINLSIICLRIFSFYHIIVITCRSTNNTFFFVLSYQDHDIKTYEITSG